LFWTSSMLASAFTPSPRVQIWTTLSNFTFRAHHLNSTCG
jgi:hypothetical protein